MMKRFDKPSKAVTIREVAREAGVSVATASYALNGLGRIAPETQDKVRKAAERLGYQPSLAAQALKGGKGNLIVILTDGFAGPWYGELLEGLQPAFKEAGFTVVAITIDRESLGLSQNLVQAGLVRGLVILNPGKAWIPAMGALTVAVPTVLFDGDESLPHTRRFVLDNRGGILGLMDHLWALGIRDYLWIDGDLETAWDARERRAAFDLFLEEKGDEVRRRRYAEGKYQRDIAHEAVARVLDDGAPPGAIVAANDESAIGALKAVRARGLAVPGDVVVAGFDGIDETNWTEPTLTTLRFDRRALGRSMACWLVSALKEGTGAPGVERISVDLVIRGSTRT